ncbi:hypothetical protein WJX73_004308 [Symbiochloris irregularis]|uniref:Ribosomal RNA-processing protein 44 n=1 Tax=Symbiochloris irregularis TaxID=706552 RepID=A0AAW1NTT2_9CHLO
MLQRKQFVKKTKKGGVVKVVREHYLRDDISSGTPLDPESDPAVNKLSRDASHYLVADTNVALHQLDFLEHSAIEDVIITSVVLEEVRHQNQSAYQRLRTLTAASDRRFFVFSNEHHRDTYITALPGESPNDRNDRAIRVAAKWYDTRMPPSMPVIFLTNDADNLRKAQEDGLRAMTVQGYAQMRKDTPELVDLVAAGVTAEKENLASDSQGGKGAKRKRIYEDHRPTAAITAGIKRGIYHQGTLRAGRAQEGRLVCDSLADEVLIRGRVALNRALDGDVVAVELLPEEEWTGDGQKTPRQAPSPGTEENGDEAAAGGDGDDNQVQVAPGEHLEDDAWASTGGKRPQAKVVGIIKRNWRSRGYAGSLQPPREGQNRAGATSWLVVPVEKRFPFIRIQTRQADALMDKRIVVVIDGWEADSMFPQGHYVRTLGVIGDKDTETEVLLLENDINTAPFSPAVHACVPPLPWAVSEAHLQDPRREDLRGLPICSVDPPGCKDIDDALHIRDLPNGNMELGVHIADVTNFLLPGTAMDDEAARRGTTVYLVQRRIDMLPKPLTEDICSLRANVDRLAFSVLWELTLDGELVGCRFTKSVIRSRAAFTYAEAQARIDDARMTDELSEGLRKMNAYAKKRRAARAAAGALQLASPEVKFEIDTETQNPMDVAMYQIRDTNQMVEEMMLMANVTVAEVTLRAFPACALLRRHPVPAPRQFEPLQQVAAATGVSIDVSSSKALSDSLDGAVRMGDAYFNTLIRILATRCMTQALYFNSGQHAESEYVHYGLAAPLYTHFTSPIRRYADVLVHRVLAATLDLAPLPPSMRDAAGLKAVVDNLNVRHRNAQMAGRASVELHTLIFFHERIVLADARITKVRSKGVIVFIPKYGIEGTIHLTPKAEDGSEPPAEYTMDEQKQTIRHCDGQLALTVFDKVAVKIQIVTGVAHRRSLSLEWMSRDELPESEHME